LEWGWVIGVAGLILGVGEAVVVYLVNKSNSQQETRFEDIKEQLTNLGKFKDEVLASYPTRSEISDHRSDCRDQFSNIFSRLRDLEKGGDK
jgi:uncharacterized membrane-anchored protein YhcB (DUF1043 family)